MDKRLNGQRVWVTQSDDYMGPATIERFQKEGAEIIMQIAKDAINLMDEQPGTSPHIALQNVLAVYMEDNDLE